MEMVVAEKKVLQRNSQRNDLLKLMALLTMLVDHIGYMYFPNEMLFRIIGRLAFPIFAYQIAIGYSKTSNLKKYALRLFTFAVITQIPYSFFSPDLAFDPLHLNVMFTFVISIVMLCIYDMGIVKIKNFVENKSFLQLLCGILLLMIALSIIALPEVLSFIVPDFYLEYGLLALGLILLFHIFREKPAAAIISIIVLYVLHGYYRVALWNSAYSSAQFWSNLFDFNFVWDKLALQNGVAELQRYYFNAWGALSLVLIYVLESINTSRFRLNKYVGYVFYPAHMALLIAIAFIMKIH